MIVLQRVAKSYGPCKALTDVTLRIAPKQYVAVVGPAGSGKTTIVRLLLRAEDPTSGAVTVDGADLKMLPIELLQLYRQRVGVVSEAVPLIDDWTAEENILYPLLLRGLDEEARRKRAGDVLKRLGIGAKASTLAGSLSPSERGLAMLARAVVAQPAVLIADEPTLHLDASQGKLALAVLKEAHKRGTTVLFLTRDERLAPDNAAILQLSDGEMKGQARAKPAEPVHHEPLLDMASHAQAETSVAVKPVPHPKKKSLQKPGRKVRITSIGSDVG